MFQLVFGVFDIFMTRRTTQKQKEEGKGLFKGASTSTTNTMACFLYGLSVLKNKWERQAPTFLYFSIYYLY